MPTIGEHTQPPCLSCHAHDQLETEFLEMKRRNYREHDEIKTNLTELKTSVGWIVTIGATLVALIGFTFLNESKTANTVAKIGTSIVHVVNSLKDQKKEIENCRDKLYKDRK